MDKVYDVYGIGNPLIDLLSMVDESFLEQFYVDKGIMQLIDIDRREQLLDQIPDPKISPGGSCANTMIALASFDKKIVYGGGIGHDHLGSQFETNLKEYKVHSALQKKSLPTGSSIILITDDAERSQNTYLGACQEYAVKDVDVDAISSSKKLYFTGYMWDTTSQKDALNYAIDIANDKQTEIIFDVADPFAVDRSKDDFLRLIKNHTNFVFANFAEAQMLTGKTHMEDILDSFQNITNSGVIKDGANGSIVFSQNTIHKVDVHHAQAVDTTGAGDMYAAGILYGLLSGYDLPKSGRVASIVAGKVVEQIGARLEFSLKNYMETNYNL